MKGPLARFEFLWMERAMSSFPVPDSPRIKTVQSWGATFRIVLVIALIGAESPTIPSKWLVLPMLAFD
jgi:hypothetical protein